MLLWLLPASCGQSGQKTAEEYNVGQQQRLPCLFDSMPHHEQSIRFCEQPTHHEPNGLCAEFALVGRLEFSLFCFLSFDLALGIFNMWQSVASVV